MKEGSSDLISLVKSKDAEIERLKSYMRDDVYTAYMTIENLKVDKATQAHNLNWLNEEYKVLEAKSQKLVEALTMIRDRFLNEFPTGMPSPERGPGLSWAMMSDARTALREFQADTHIECEVDEKATKKMKNIKVLPDNDIGVLKERLFKKVKTLMKWDDKKAQFWFKTENPLFGYIAPDRLIFNGRGHKVEQFIDDAIEEQRLFDAQSKS